MAYLERLAAEFDIRLVSFEKDSRPAPDVVQRLASAGVQWVPLRYHRRPPVGSTTFDISRGARVLGRLLRDRPADILHARSYVPMEMVLRTPSARASRVLFDIRGFWADERVEGGIWRRGGALYRYAKRRERVFFRRADAVVTLTHASVPVIEEWTGAERVPIDVIPTCTQVGRFSASQPGSGGPRAVWAGSLSTWYRFDLGVRLARVGGLPLAVFTRETQAARAAAPDAVDIRSLPQEEMPDALRAGDIGLCLYRPGFSRLATAPTRLAEYLAAGMPVAVSGGVGDLAGIVHAERVGVALEDDGDEALAEAAAELKRLAADTEVRERCRRVAAARFDISAGTRRYAEIYHRMITMRSGR